MHWLWIIFLMVTTAITTAIGSYYIHHHQTADFTELENFELVDDIIEDLDIFAVTLPVDDNDESKEETDSSPSQTNS